jgi:hypothetical protein
VERACGAGTPARFEPVPKMPAQIQSPHRTLVRGGSARHFLTVIQLAKSPEASQAKSTKFRTRFPKRETSRLEDSQRFGGGENERIAVVRGKSYAAAWALAFLSLTSALAPRRSA